MMYLREIYVLEGRFSGFFSPHVSWLGWSTREIRWRDCLAFPRNNCFFLPSAAAQLWWNNTYSGSSKGLLWVWPWSSLALSSFVSDSWTERLWKRSGSKLSLYSYLLPFYMGLGDPTSDGESGMDWLVPLGLWNLWWYPFLPSSCLHH